MHTLPILLTLGLGWGPFARADLTELIARALTARGGERTAARVELRRQAPRGPRFVTAALTQILSFERPWDKDDRRMDVLALTMERNPDPTRIAGFDHPEARAELRRLGSALLDDVAGRRDRTGWRHLEDTISFMSHFDLWSGVNVRFLADEVRLRTRRVPRLTEILIRHFADASDEDRARIRADADARPRFVLAALLWLHDPALDVHRTLVAWLRFEISGRGHDVPEPMRSALRTLAVRLDADLRARIGSADRTLLAGLERLSSADDPDLGLLNENERARVRSAIARLKGERCPDLY